MPATHADHLRHLKSLFQLLQQAGLTVKMAKCQFGRNSRQYPGFQLTSTCAGCSQPKMPKTLLIFLEWWGGIKSLSLIMPICVNLCANWRENVLVLSGRLRPRALMKNWKIALKIVPVLVLLDYNNAFEFFYRCPSSTNFGAMRAQKYRPIGYASRILSSAERNYLVMDRECLAVV